MGQKNLRKNGGENDRSAATNRPRFPGCGYDEGEVMEQPKPLEIEIPIINDAIMYSMMTIGDLMKLRQYMDDLIKWIAAGNPVHIGTIEYSITEEKDE